jgi:hypothetical protein
VNRQLSISLPPVTASVLLTRIPPSYSFPRNPLRKRRSQPWFLPVPSNNFQSILDLEEYGMWSKKMTVYVCLLVQLAMALAMACPSVGKNSSAITEAPSDHDNHPRPSNSWALSKKLSLRQVQANPSAFNVKDSPRRRSPCSL